MNATEEKRQLLRDPGVEPADEILKAALGEAYGTYVAFIAGMKGRGIDVVWRYYPDGKAWLAKGHHRRTGARGGVRETTAFWLSAWEGLFRVTVYLPVKARAAALAAAPDDETRGKIADARQMGKMNVIPLTFDVKSLEPLGALYALAALRVSLK